MRLLLAWSAGLIVTSAFVVLMLVLPSYADDVQSSPERRKWFQNQQIPHSARERLRRDHGVNYASCCDAGDRFRTRFRVGSVGQDVWEYLDGDKGWKVVPPDIINDAPSIDEEPILFRRKSDGVPLCFFVGKGGS
jgi:hypothetical protein